MMPQIRIGLGNIVPECMSTVNTFGEGKFFWQVIITTMEGSGPFSSQMNCEGDHLRAEEFVSNTL